MLKRMSMACYALTATVGVQACSDDDSSRAGPAVAEALPSALSAVANTGFEQPGDAVSSHDGQTFYFTAFRAVEEDMVAAIMTVPSTGGAVEALASGAPLGHPTGLVMSCDGSTLYIADRAPEGMEDDNPDESEDATGALFAADVVTGIVTRLRADEVGIPAGMALSVDCSTLYVSGRNAAGEPALFTVSVEGGGVRTVLAGEPLVAPTGLHVDKDGVAWVMDHLAEGHNGPGVLFAIDDRGGASEVISNLKMGTPGGVSLNASGTVAFMPTLDRDGQGRLTSVRLATGEVKHIAAPALSDPAGLRTARNASVFAVVDAESATIYRAE